MHHEHDNIEDEVYLFERIDKKCIDLQLQCMQKEQDTKELFSLSICDLDIYFQVFLPQLCSAQKCSKTPLVSTQRMPLSAEIL